LIFLENKVFYNWQTWHVGCNYIIDRMLKGLKGKMGSLPALVRAEVTGASETN
jgi:hypothetical protein